MYSVQVSGSRLDLTKLSGIKQTSWAEGTTTNSQLPSTTSTGPYTPSIPLPLILIANSAWFDCLGQPDIEVDLTRVNFIAAYLATVLSFSSSSAPQISSFSANLPHVLALNGNTNFSVVFTPHLGERVWCQIQPFGVPGEVPDRSRRNISHISVITTPHNQFLVFLYSL
jgi:hypothetical protein